MKLFIQTQVRENYAAHDWDGKGECPQGWKNKGGSDYVVEDYTFTSVEQMRKDIGLLTPSIERNDDYFIEYIIDYEVVEDNYMSEYEKDQLEYEGKITYPSKKIEIPEPEVKAVYEESGMEM